MQKHIISTDKAPQAIGTYSQAAHVTGGSTVYLSGQIPLVPETMEMIEGDTGPGHHINLSHRLSIYVASP